MRVGRLEGSEERVWVRWLWILRGGVRLVLLGRGKDVRRVPVDVPVAQELGVDLGPEVWVLSGEGVGGGAWDLD
jgi:hypothetical protein